jgi:very-short-patch-repair endonuclease
MFVAVHLPGILFLHLKQRQMTDGILTVAEIMQQEEFWEPLPDIDFEYELNKCKSVFEQQQIFKTYYNIFNDRILKAAERGKWFRPYFIDFTRYFTPIEREAWNAIRSSRIILYPQYPVLNYFLDFGNPYLKIGLEMDGKEFHNAEKDFIRDTKLLNEGWKIFRVTGSEAVRPVREIYDHTDEYEVRMTKCMNIHNTVEGIINAIYYVYFNKKEQVNYHYYDEYITCLNDHRLADFYL